MFYDAIKRGEDELLNMLLTMLYLLSTSYTFEKKIIKCYSKIDLNKKLYY